MGNPVKVIHIVEDLRTGGLEKVVCTIVVNLDRSGFDPQVWCLARGGAVAEQIASRGVTVRVSDMGQRPSLRFLLRLAGGLRRENAHVVHCHGYTACTVGRAAAILARTPRVFAHMHTQAVWLEPRQRWIEQALSAFSTKIICVSESVREFVIQAERIPRKKTEVIYNGIPDPPLPDRQCARRQFRIREEAKVLGCVASLEPHKGHDVLIEAVRIAGMRLGNIVLLVVGDGSLRRQLEIRAREAGISSIFAGSMEDVGVALASVDVMALLSLEREGLSLAILEAMAASKPVILSRLGGLPELIEDGASGLLCRAGDATEAADCIVKVLASIDLGRAMGAVGRRRFLEKFTVERMVTDIERLYGR